MTNSFSLFLSLVDSLSLCHTLPRSIVPAGALCGFFVKANKSPDLLIGGVGSRWTHVDGFGRITSDSDIVVKDVAVANELYDRYQLLDETTWARKCRVANKKRAAMNVREVSGNAVVAGPQEDNKYDDETDDEFTFVRARKERRTFRQQRFCVLSAQSDSSV